MEPVLLGLIMEYSRLYSQEIEDARRFLSRPCIDDEQESVRFSKEI